jgi:hypothetical protein
MGKTRKGSEDSSKKRDSRQVVQNGPSSDGDRDAKPKKLRSRKTTDRAANQVTDENEPHLDDGKDKLPLDETPVAETVQDRAICENEVNDMDDATENRAALVKWDLEHALHHVVSMGDGCKEPLSKDSYLSFRVGHSGDSSAIEKCYRITQGKSVQSFKNPEVEEQKTSKSGQQLATLSHEELQAHLTTALGDEDNPPFAFALLAEVSSSVETSAPKSIAAAAILSSESVISRIRIEWMYIDQRLETAALLERRLWLRLCALSVLMSCDLVGTTLPEDRLRQEAENVVSG